MRTDTDIGRRLWTGTTAESVSLMPDLTTLWLSFYVLTSFAVIGESESEIMKMISRPPNET